MVVDVASLTGLQLQVCCDAQLPERKNFPNTWLLRAYSLRLISKASTLLTEIENQQILMGVVPT